MRPNKKVIVAIIIILAFLALGAAAYYVLQPIKVCCSDPATANWQTYRNDEYGFEVKYPTNYSLKNILIEPWKSNSEIERVGAIEISNGKNVINIDIHNNMNNYPLEKWITEFSQLGAQPSLSEKEMGAFNGTLYVRGVFGCCKSFNLTAFSASRGHVYLLKSPINFDEYTQSRDNEMLSNERFFNQILSTFKFIE